MIYSMLNLLKIFLVLAIILLNPRRAGAAGLFDSLREFQNLLSLLIPISFMLALIFFFWGVVKFIASAGSEEAKTEGKNIMVWGVVVLFIMSSVWGIVEFFQRDLLGTVPSRIETNEKNHIFFMRVRRFPCDHFSTGNRKPIKRSRGVDGVAPNSFRECHTPPLSHCDQRLFWGVSEIDCLIRRSRRRIFWQESYDCGSCCASCHVVGLGSTG